MVGKATARRLGRGCDSQPSAVGHLAVGMAPIGALGWPGHSRGPRDSQHVKIIDVEGIGSVYAQKLIAAGVRTTEALLERA